MLSRKTELARLGTKLRDVGGLTLSCAHCHLRSRCLPSGLSLDELGEMREVAPRQRRVARGEALYQAGDSCHSIYAVRLGFFKSYVVTQDGRSQITGFQMAGDILGLDGADTGTHTQSVVALEVSDVCVFSYAKLETAAGNLQALQHKVRCVMSREIAREHAMMVLLGTARAEERVAAFLLNLSERYGELGYSEGEFNLRMTREEMGSYLGLKLETVSRMFSHFQECGLITAQHRYVHILDRPKLARLAGRNVLPDIHETRMSQ